MLFTLPLFELCSIFDHLTAASPRGLESAIVSTGPGGSFAISNGTINWRSRVITTVSFSVVWLFDKRFFIFFYVFLSLISVILSLRNFILRMLSSFIETTSPIITLYTIISFSFLSFLFFFLFFFSIRVFFHEHSQFTGQQGKGNDTTLI